MKKKEKEKKPSVIKNNLYFLRLLWDISPMRVLLGFVFMLFEFAMWTFYSVYFMQYLFGGTARSFTEAAIFIAIANALDIARVFLQARYYNVFIPKTNVRIHYALNKKLFEKAQTVDLSCYETPDFYNTYTKAATEASSRATAVLDACSLTVSSLVSSVFIIITMCRITPWALLFITLPLFGNLYFGKKLGKETYQKDQEQTPSVRRHEYVNRVMYFRQYAGEVRLTGVFDVLRNIYTIAAKETVDISIKHAKKLSFYSITKSTLMFVFGFEGMWVFAAALAINGQISVGELVVLLNAIVSVSWMINDLQQGITDTMTNTFFIDNLRTFFAYQPKIDESAGGDTPPQTVDTIEFRHVSFRYPTQKKDALHDVTLTFRRGVRHALVGINGSGKSTLLKLILRFYDPTEGEILLNGVDIRTYDIKQYRALIGAAFQDFAIFAATVTENVLLHEIHNENEHTRAVNALRDSDAYGKISTLPQQENTLLTKEFDNDGVELSGGERQKLAIARAFAKDSPIVILDEPSSALDPVAEYKMFKTIIALCDTQKKLSIIVSHRLSSAAVCEQIFVFDSGKLVEQGTHATLLANGDLYADMFRKQARNYLVEGGERHG